MKIKWQKYLDTLEEEILDEIEDDKEEPEFYPVQMKPQAFTHGGIVPDDYNLWIAHTDFRILPSHVDQIQSVDGVEIVKVATPYRFMLGVGMCFDEHTVKLGVQKILGVGRMKDINIETIKSNFTKPYWAIYRFPNGKTEKFESDDEEEVYAKLETYDALQKETGGEVLYWITDGV